ncbi:hypothetical protein J2T08_000557 [Neorhizobium galegae]|uniref:hypothetical protein n=1 Tax=Neorhizobium galegae TaxID=399 RepID=UPI0027855D2A|nr:hypothetical protein [Neorhizobium galegae]MDQ0132656.1 hypothetical protein [Neorhizobium galegae]
MGVFTFIVLTFRPYDFATLGETLPKKGIRAQSTRLQAKDVSHGRDTPEAGCPILAEIGDQRRRHANNRLPGAICADQDVGFVVADDVKPAPVQLEVEKHPRLRPFHESETGNVLEPAAGQPIDPFRRGDGVENDIPVLRLAIEDLQSAWQNIRTHRAASISLLASSKQDLSGRNGYLR